MVGLHDCRHDRICSYLGLLLRTLLADLDPPEAPKTSRTQQRGRWESIVDEAETYATSLGCPMALVSATHFFDFGCITHFEAIRDAHKLRVLDTIDKVTEFKKKFVIVFLSQRCLALRAPHMNSMHFETMCVAKRGGPPQLPK